MLPFQLTFFFVLATVSGQKQDYIILNNGLKFPSVSFGLQVYDDTTAQNYTRIAIQAGVRNFFASVLAGNQVGFGKGVKSMSGVVPRKELFVCGSVNSGGSCSGFEDCKAKTAQGCKTNLQDLGMEYLDMIMLDYPASDCDSISGQWAAFEDMLQAGLTRSVAVSNFDLGQLDCIVSNKSFVAVPAVNQMSYSVGHGSDPVVADDAKRTVAVQAYSPLAAGALIKDPDCVQIGQAHNKTGAQVALRWIVQRNATFTTSAASALHFEQDLDIFDFELSAAEMARLNAKQL
mmetsp:Transcript_16703/g.32510  ORF Transcript_16703/g.32510 Transcript_16703/m.32510 type:complete len:289 (-) Transcript_16703:3-869(-)